MDKLMSRLGVQWEEIPVSKRSKEFSPGSSFTACVHDVAIGNVDMCWGNFWPISARRRLASFTGALYQDTFQVIVNQKTRDTSFLDSLKRPFEPFSTALWCLTFAVLGFVGVYLTWHTSPASTTAWTMLPKVPMSAARGWHAISAGEIRAVPVQTAGGWLIQFSIGLAKIVLIAGYTGLTAATLVKQAGTEVSSFQEAINARFRFCANPNIISSVVAQHPEVDTLMVGVPKSEILDRMDRGECEAAIMDEDQWRNERLWGADHHCKTKARLPDVVITEQCMIVTRDELQRGLSWAIRTEIEAGTYDVAKAAALKNYTAQLCQEKPAVGKKNVLNVSDLGAPLLFLLVVTLASMGMNRMGAKLEKAHGRLSKSMDASGDNAGSVVARVLNTGSSNASKLRIRSASASRLSGSRPSR